MARIADSAFRDCRVQVSCTGTISIIPERSSILTLDVRAHLEVAMRNHGSPQVGGQPGRAHPARFPAPQKNGPAVGVTVMSHPRLRSCLSSSAGSCGTFTIR